MTNVIVHTLYFQIRENIQRIYDRNFVTQLVKLKVKGYIIRGKMSDNCDE